MAAPLLSSTPASPEWPFATASDDPDDEGIWSYSPPAAFWEADRQIAQILWTPP